MSGTLFSPGTFSPVEKKVPDTFFLPDTFFPTFFPDGPPFRLTISPPGSSPRTRAPLEQAHDFGAVLPAC